jgi:hypothetical protein
VAPLFVQTLVPCGCIVATVFLELRRLLFYRCKVISEMIWRTAAWCRGTHQMVLALGAQVILWTLEITCLGLIQVGVIHPSAKVTLALLSCTWCIIFTPNVLQLCYLRDFRCWQLFVGSQRIFVVDLEVRVYFLLIKDRFLRLGLLYGTFPCCNSNVECVSLLTVWRIRGCILPGILSSKIKTCIYCSFGWFNLLNHELVHGF